MPKVAFSISDKQLTKLLDLLLSIPIPTTNIDDEEENLETHITLPPVSAARIRDCLKIKAIMDATDLETAGIEKKKKLSESNLIEVDPQLFIFDFRVGEVSALLFSQKFQVLNY